MTLTVQQGQVSNLDSKGVDAGALWAYRYRTGGSGSKRVQRGGFASEDDARAALARALEKLRRDNGIAKPVTLAAPVRVLGRARGGRREARQTLRPDDDLLRRHRHSAP